MKNRKKLFISQNLNLKYFVLIIRGYHCFDDIVLRFVLLLSLEENETLNEAIKTHSLNTLKPSNIFKYYLWYMKEFNIEIRNDKNE